MITFIGCLESGFTSKIPLHLHEGGSRFSARCKHIWRLSVSDHVEYEIHLPDFSRIVIS